MGKPTVVWTSLLRRKEKMNLKIWTLIDMERLNIASAKRLVFLFGGDII
jgi:hypothetical protein